MLTRTKTTWSSSAQVARKLAQRTPMWEHQAWRPVKSIGEEEKYVALRDLFKLFLAAQFMEALELFVGDPAVGHQGELDGVRLLGGGLDLQVLVRVHSL